MRLFLVTLMRQKIHGKPSDDALRSAYLADIAPFARSAMINQLLFTNFSLTFAHIVSSNWQVRKPQPRQSCCFLFKHFVSLSSMLPWFTTINFFNQLYEGDSIWFSLAQLTSPKAPTRANGWCCHQFNDFLFRYLSVSRFFSSLNNQVRGITSYLSEYVTLKPHRLFDVQVSYRITQCTLST